MKKPCFMHFYDLYIFLPQPKQDPCSPMRDGVGGGIGARVFIGKKESRIKKRIIELIVMVVNFYIVSHKELSLPLYI